MWKPTNLNECLITDESLAEINSCNFNTDNILLRGRSGVGKTTICRILLDMYPCYSIIENINEYSMLPNSKIIATTTNLNLQLSNFKGITLMPLPPLILLKKLSKFNILSTKKLFYCINSNYPNINKILEMYSK